MVGDLGLPAAQTPSKLNTRHKENTHIYNKDIFLKTGPSENLLNLQGAFNESPISTSPGIVFVQTGNSFLFKLGIVFIQTGNSFQGHTEDRDDP